MQKSKSTLLLAFLLASANASAQTPAALTVKVSGFENGTKIPEKYAFCAPDGKGKTKDGGNVNPAISWEGAPSGTKSFALIVVDRDVPQSFDSANKEGQTIPYDMPRQDFYHWVLVDIPVNMVSIAEGADSKQVLPTGKQIGKTAYGFNGQNDFASFMSGTFGGYDGPCPPWNDERLHHYHFIVYALDTDSLGVSGTFGGKYAEDLMKGHILAKGEVMGTYSNNGATR